MKRGEWTNLVEGRCTSFSSSVAKKYVVHCSKFHVELLLIQLSTALHKLSAASFALLCCYYLLLVPHKRDTPNKELCPNDVATNKKETSFFW